MMAEDSPLDGRTVQASPVPLHQAGVSTFSLERPGKI